jgi:hypothetical protein
MFVSFQLLIRFRQPTRTVLRSRMGAGSGISALRITVLTVELAVNAVPAPPGWDVMSA